MNFHVGQKVVCVGDWSPFSHRPESLPVKGAVYTVREIGEFALGVGLRLEEIVNLPRDYPLHGMVEASFSVHAFRPVKTTDVSILTAMLAPEPNAPAKKRERQDA